jgi:hypothetical protein
MQGYADQPSMEDALGRLASNRSKAEHEAWQETQESGGGSVSMHVIRERL